MVKSITVGELIDTLSKYDESMEVFATWEGIIVDIRRDGISVEDDYLLIEVTQPASKARQRLINLCLGFDDS